MNLLLKWNNPTDQAELTKLVLYRLDASALNPSDITCKTLFYGGEKIFEKESNFAGPGAEESYIDENVNEGSWCYAVFAYHTWGESVCSLGTFTVEGGSSGSTGSTGSTGSSGGGSSGDGADTTWTNLGIPAPNSNRLPGTAQFAGGNGPDQNEGDTSNTSNSGCADQLQGAFLATFYYDEDVSQPCSRSVLSTGPYLDFALDEWYHLVLVRQDDTSVLYINGTPTAVSTNMKEGPYFRNVPQIGALYASTYRNDWCWNGLIDQPATWVRALGPDDVLELYNGGNGQPYSSMSNNLKNGLRNMTKFNGPVTYNGLDIGPNIYGGSSAQHISFEPAFSLQENNIVDELTGDKVRVTVRSGSHTTAVPLSFQGGTSIEPGFGAGTGKPMDITVNDGKVNSWSFAPCRDDILRDATGSTKAEAIASTCKARAALMAHLPSDIDVFNDPWSNRSGEFHPIYWTTSLWIKKYGEARSYGVGIKIDTNSSASDAGGAILSDYRGFSNNSHRYANLMICDRGNKDSSYPLWNLS